MQKKAHCTKKKTHEAFQVLRSFVLNVIGSIQKKNGTKGKAAHHRDARKGT
jgi:hypothetical protein